MAITKLKGLVGEAEVLGRLREVVWNEAEGSVFAIKGMSLEESERALNLLSTGTIAAVRPPEKQPSKEALVHAAIARATEPTPKAPEEVKQIVAEMNSELEKAAKEQDAKKVNGAPKVPECSCGAALTPENSSKSPATGKLTHVNCPQNAAPVAPPAPAQASGEPSSFDTGVLAKMTSLGEVVVYLYEKGHTTPEAVVAACNSVKDKVPLVGRVANLDERVRRSFEVKGLGAQA